MNMCIIGKNSMKLYYLKKKIFTVTLTWKILLMRITCLEKKVCKDFKIKSFGEYHNLYAQGDTLLLADVFEMFKIFVELYEVDPVSFLTAPGLAWQAALKETKVKLYLLIDIDILLIVGKRY